MDPQRVCDRCSQDLHPLNRTGICAECELIERNQAIDRHPAGKQLGLDLMPDPHDA
jgi:hypothetical protein